MKISLRFLLVFGVMLICVGNSAEAQPKSDRGKEFWLTMLPRDGDYDERSEYAREQIDPRTHPEAYTPFTLSVVIYSQQPTTVELSIPRASWKQTIYTGDERAYTVSIPVSLILPYHLHRAEDIGMRITADHPIALVTSGGTASSSRNESSFIYPKELLGREYHIGSHHTIWNHIVAKITDDKSWLHWAGYVVLATEDGTQVNIEYGLPGWNGPTQLTLQRGQTHIVRRDTGFASNIVTANKPIAIFTIGSIGWPGTGINGFAGVFAEESGCEQLLPVEQWGKTYYSVPMDYDKDYNIYNKYPTWTQITASQNNTTVKVDNITITLNRGKTFDTVAIAPLVIVADKPVIATQTAAGMKIKPPDLPKSISAVGSRVFQQLLGRDRMQLGRTIFSAAPPTYGISNTKDYNLDYITVITATRDTAKVFLDEVNIGSAFRCFAADSLMSYAQVRVDTRFAHELFSTGRYQLYTYGWTAGTYYRSFANATGIGLNAGFSYRTDGCDGKNYQLQGVAEGGATRWTWDFGDGSPEVETATLGLNESGDAVTEVFHDYAKGGIYEVRLRVLYDWSGGVEDTVTRRVVVWSPPRAKLTADKDILCPGATTKIRAEQGF